MVGALYELLVSTFRRLIPRDRLRRNVRDLIVLSIDVVAAGLAFILAFQVIVSARSIFLPGIFDKTLGFSLCALVVFALMGHYRGSWRFFSTTDLLNIIKSSAVAVVVYTVVAFLVTRGANVPRSVLVVAFIFCVFSLGGMRLLYRLAVEHGIEEGVPAGRDRKRKSVLIYGFTDLADGYIRASRRRVRGTAAVLGIVDDVPLLGAQTLHGVPVRGTVLDLARIIEGHSAKGIEIEEIIVAKRNLPRSEMALLMEASNRLSIRVTRLPDPSDTAALTAEQCFVPRPIELRDLLERQETSIDLGTISDLVSDRVVLVTGAGGSIGSELSRQIASLKPRLLVITDSSEINIFLLLSELADQHPGVSIATHMMDVRDRSRVEHVFRMHNPEIVFHAAALKHVPLVEDNPLEGIKTNLLGTRNVADCALAYGASSCVVISTDKAVNPESVMGATKRAAEKYCQALDLRSSKTRFSIVRFGNVLGSTGSVVPLFQQQIAAGGPVTVTHPEAARFFMTIPEAVRLVMHAVGHANHDEDERGAVLILNMGEPIKIIDLAERVIQLSGLVPREDIEIVFTGLRPGERLHEQLFTDEDGFQPSEDGSFFIAEPPTLDWALMDKSMKDLEASAAREEVQKSMQLLGHLVPEYSATRSPVVLVEASSAGKVTTVAPSGLGQLQGS